MCGIAANCCTAGVIGKPHFHQMFEALQLLPNIELHVENLVVGSRPDDEVQAKSMPTSIMDIWNIRSIKVHIGYEHPVAMRWLKDVLLSSPRLEVLHLTLPRSEDDPWRSDGLGIFDFCIEPGERLSSLKELVYESRFCPGDACTIPASFFNWMKIRTLTLRGLRMITLVAALESQHLQLTNLTLEYCCEGQDFEHGGQVVNGLISRLRGLETLSLVNPVERVPTWTIAVHGGTLRELSIRSPRHPYDPYSTNQWPHLYTVSDVDILRVTCPHLKNLALDVAFVSDLPCDVLAAFAHFPQLTNLTLFVHFEIDGSTHHKIAFPCYRMELLIVRHTFSYLCQHKVGLPFTRLNIVLGSFPLESGQNPARIDRPNLMFCCFDVDGEVVVDDGFDGNFDRDWDFYFTESTPR